MISWVIGMGGALIMALVIFGFGTAVGYYSHPYEQCSRMYVGEDYIGECVWLKLKGY